MNVSLLSSILLFSSLLIRSDLMYTIFSSAFLLLCEAEFLLLLLLLVQLSCPLIKNVLLLDAEGKRVAVKYFSDDWPNLSAKLAFEKSVFSKTQRTNARAEGKGFS